jgi:TPR repeat protein
MSSQKTNCLRTQYAEQLYDDALELYHEQQYVEALKLFKDSADLGHSRAKWKLGNMYRKGTGVPKNLDMAEKYYRDAGNTFTSCYGLIQLYMERKDTQKLHQSSVSYLKGIIQSKDSGLPLIRWCDHFRTIASILVGKEDQLIFSALKKLLSYREDDTREMYDELLLLAQLPLNYSSDNPLSLDTKYELALSICDDRYHNYCKFIRINSEPLVNLFEDLSKFGHIEGIRYYAQMCRDGALIKKDRVKSVLLFEKIKDTKNALYVLTSLLLSRDQVPNDQIIEIIKTFSGRDDVPLCIKIASKYIT